MKVAELIIHASVLLAAIGIPCVQDSLGQHVLAVTPATMPATVPAEAISYPKSFVLEGNPFFKDDFTADPAPMVYKDTLYLYTGHDEAKGNEQYKMNNWFCFSTRDMKNWTALRLETDALSAVCSMRSLWSSGTRDKEQANNE